LTTLTSGLPDLSSDYTLEPLQVESYRRDGHVLLRSVVSPWELAVYRSHLVAASIQGARESGIEIGVGAEGRNFVHVMNLWEKSAVAKRFSFSRRFARIATELMGVDGVRLYHDQCLFKESGGKRTEWHSDQDYWPVDTRNTITMWMALSKVTREMGAMRFASGSHQAAYPGTRQFSEESDEFFGRLIAENGYSVEWPELSPGDAIFWAGPILHSAPGNLTETLREVIAVIYYADGARLLRPDNVMRSHDMERFFPGQKPGDVAASQINPLLYPIPPDGKRD
jgi:hypothetical protein